MAIYVITGKPGAGKTLIGVGRIREYLLSERKVVSNLDLNLDVLIGPMKKTAKCTRISDLPTSHHLENIGLGYDGEYEGEHRNGGIFLDECALFLNTRDFADKEVKEERKKMLNWLLLSRHYRWDVYFMIQNFETLDKQYRISLGEHVVYCRRMDRVHIPFFGSLVYWLSLTMLELKVKAHQGMVKYGHTHNAPSAGNWWYRGDTLYDAYNTEQEFNPNKEQFYSHLPPYYTVGYKTNIARHIWTQTSRAISRIRIPAKSKFFFGLMAGWLYLHDFVDDLFSGWSPDLNPMSSMEVIASEPDKSESNIQQQPEEPQYYVVGQLQVGNHNEYLFQTPSGTAFYPEWHGYKVRPVNRCKVGLVRDRKMIYARCPPDEAAMQSGEAGGHLKGALPQITQTSEPDTPETRVAVQQQDETIQTEEAGTADSPY